MLKFFTVSLLGLLFASPLGSFPNGKLLQKKVPAPTIVGAEITAYCPCKRCTGRYARYKKTKAGTDARIPGGIAADLNQFPLGTKVCATEIGGCRVVDDTGSAMREAAKQGQIVLDFRFKKHRGAKEFGRKTTTVAVYN